MCKVEQHFNNVVSTLNLPGVRFSVHLLCSEAKWPVFTKYLHVFRYGDNLGRARTNQHKGAGFFFSGVLTALTCVAVSI